MSAIDLLESRMKQYEASFTNTLPPRLPYVIRINYHSSSSLRNMMSQDTIDSIFQYIANNMSNNIQGCVLAYRNIDEISFVVLNNKNANTQSWLGGDVSSIVSITSSMATAFFINALTSMNLKLDSDKIPIFKSKVFVIQDMNEVNSYFTWRDHVKNKIDQTNILIIKSNNQWVPVYIKSSSDNETMLDFINKVHNTYLKGVNNGN